MSVSDSEVLENVNNCLDSDDVRISTQGHDGTSLGTQNTDHEQSQDQDPPLSNLSNDIVPTSTEEDTEEHVIQTMEHQELTAAENAVQDQVALENTIVEPLHSDVSINQVNQESSESVREEVQELVVQEEEHSSENIDVQPSQKREERKSSSSEIQEESLRNKLHEIIQEISFEVSQEENEPKHHTWKPKGNYEVPKTEIKFEEVVPVKVPDIEIKERSQSSEKTPKPKKKSPNKGSIEAAVLEAREQYLTEESNYHYSIDAQKILRHAVVNGEPLSPQEIPIGIPLLAKILPKEESGDEEPREKIPLERLFTPASDAENLIPLKKKRAFASSCFYRPDHPTIDDQVELAHKISTSLIDENNKSSRGQTMYMKRKNRSSKWIHEGGATQSREAWQQETVVHEENKSSKEKPQLKLLLSPKKIQDFNAVQKHYEELMSTSFESTRHITRMEVGKEIATNLESPTGKGAALFAKRKKRMDKFIVDESTIQQQQQQENKKSHEVVSSQQSSLSNEQNSTFSNLDSNTLHENGYQNYDTSFGELNSTDQETPVYKAEVKLIQKPLSASPALEFSAPLSLHKLINDDDFTAKKEDKRKSFNLAPKGWGTYNTFYTPVHLEAK